MKVYVEEIEDLSVHGLTTYSLINGMEMYRAEVRASGIEIFERDEHENETGQAINEEHPQYEVLKNALVKEIYKEK